MKAGVKTTEFWFTAIASVWSALSPALPPWVHGVAPIVAAAAYALARGLAKSNPNPAAGAAAFTTGNP